MEGPVDAEEHARRVAPRRLEVLAVDRDHDPALQPRRAPERTQLVGGEPDRAGVARGAHRLEELRDAHRRRAKLARRRQLLDAREVAATGLAEHAGPRPGAAER